MLGCCVQPFCVDHTLAQLNTQVLLLFGMQLTMFIYTYDELCQIASAVQSPLQDSVFTCANHSLGCTW